MASSTHTPWYLRRPSGWRQFQSIPLSRLWPLFLAVFMLFSTFGFYGDLMGGGRTPYLVVVVGVLQSGLVAALWIIVLARLPMIFLLIPIVFSVASAWIVSATEDWLTQILSLQPVGGEAGIRFSATGTVVVILLSYVLFVTFIRREGKESFKLRNELELAHGIQQTLVPPFTVRTALFEVYGISKPSEKVGGDLVDALELPSGAAIAYMGDIAGHGLQAGILMGMLKAAARTALLGADESGPSRTLPALLGRLNAVLPGVKEAHMYATFTAFRLGADGSVFYAMAASPPILHWHAEGLALSKMEESQFPLGLLPVPEFGGNQLEMARGDLLVVATDGILEVCGKSEEEFGVERLERTIGERATAPLPELAGKILEAANGFGKQVDDQTILLVRRL
ncbi:MAG: PP2C family protein-serine/threonine phosphatase [Acidobacteriaceae bacterium]